MENNEKKTPDNRPENSGGKKPHRWHNHRRKPNRPQNSQPTEQNTGDTITVRPGRYDVPPPEDKKQEITVNSNKLENKPQQNREGSSRQSHQHRRKNSRRRDNANQAANTEANPAAANTVDVPSSGENNENNRNKNNHKHTRDRMGQPESVQNERSTENAAETAQYSEYITTAGSIDEEIKDEINSITAADAERMNELESISEPTHEVPMKKYEIVGIRFKSGGKIYYFDPNGLKLNYGENVIVETSRGLEFGICDIINRTVTEREVILPLRTVVRRASAEDVSRHEANVVREKEAFEVCAQKILEHKLGMKLIDVELAFDGSKLLFYFTAEGRVDFRELVKDLAASFRTRIELRQIGIRDETKLLGGIGICGRPFCCKTFLSDFVQVSIKMAKEQNLSLNSAKISGACGRLMCCLRYEHDTYQEEIKKTPKVDQIVSTPDGEGTVIEVQPLAGLVRVRFGTKAEMITPKVYHRDDVKVIGGKGVKPKETAQSE